MYLFSNVLLFMDINNQKKKNIIDKENFFVSNFTYRVQHRNLAMEMSNERLTTLKVFFRAEMSGIKGIYQCDSYQDFLKALNQLRSGF